MVCVTAPTVMHLRHLLCTIFDRNTACQFFQILFSLRPLLHPKKHLDCDFQKSGFGFDSKNPLRGWILWIHDPFLDLSKQNKKKKAKNPVLDSQILIWIFPKKTHTKYRRLREGSFTAHSRFYVWFPCLFDCNISVVAATPRLHLTTALVTKNVPCFGVPFFSILVKWI